MTNPLLTYLGILIIVGILGGLFGVMIKDLGVKAGVLGIIFTVLLTAAVVAAAFLIQAGTVGLDVR